VNQSGSNPKADWYQDPSGRFEHRYFNGVAWTADVSTGGLRYVDPVVLGSATAGGDGRSDPGVGARPRRDRIATAAMVLGIVGLSISWLPFLVVPGAICALLGVTFGVVAYRRRRPENRSFAITGAVTGGAGILMAGVGVWTTSIVFDVVDEFENPPPYDVEITRCAVAEGSLIVEGTIENLGDKTADYRVLLTVPGERALTGRNVTIEVDDVDPEETGTFRESFAADNRFDDLVDAPICLVRDVTGPLPFGVDIDPDA